MRLYASKVFSVDQLIAGSQNNVTSISDLVLLSHVAHVKELFVMEYEELS
jgi:hypothetical protein